jgi:hypothetical protein
MMHTKDKLAVELRKLGLTKMADQAEKGHFHDFMSPLDFPTVALVSGLAEAAIRNKDHGGAIMALRSRVIDGEFDASQEESDEWANSPEGQSALSMLHRR